MKRFVSLLVLALSLAAAAPVLAATVTETYSRELTILTGNCTDPVAVPECTYTQIAVVDTNGDRPTQVCVVSGSSRAIDELGYEPITIESGCAPIAASDLTIDGRLSAAALAATAIPLELCDYRADPNNPECAPSRTATVSATASGLSMLNRAVDTYNNVAEGCRYVIRVITEWRTGPGTIVIDGIEYTGEATILEQAVTERAIC